MPAITKRRKAMAAAPRQLAAPATQQTIQAFGRISKSQVQVHGKSALGKKEASIDAPLDNGSNVTIGKKRKIRLTEDDFREQEHSGKPNSTGESRPPKDGGSSVEEDKDNAASAAGFLPSANATTPRKKRFLRQSGTETPTKGASFLLETLALPSSSPCSTTSSPIANPHGTPPSSPVSAESPLSSQNAASTLPEELQDLINLHSSFLTVLSFHYAHNGSMTPADLRNLAPGIERAWRKRKATTDDVRRILALERDETPNGMEKAGPLSLTDYGHGKICVEIAACHGQLKAQRRPLNEDALNSIFVRNLRQQWTSFKTPQPPNPSPNTFISSLNLAPIIPCPSLSKIAPLLSRGQRRLEDLKAGAIRAQIGPLQTTTANSIRFPRPKGKLIGARSTDLFSRLKAKQLQQSTLPLPPSTEVLARKSALQRLPEVAPVLDSLAVSSKKHCDDDASVEVIKSRVTHVSFTMPTVVQHLQMSLRNPIGKEEASRCVRLLAEVIPEWVGVREIGKLISVTVHGLGIGRDELGRRIGMFVERL